MSTPKNHRPGKPGHLPRLPRDRYHGRVVAFWTHGIYNRTTGWLTPGFYCDFREILLHTCSRYDLACPAFCLMPDHFHLLWIGMADSTDQLSATAFLRKHVTPFFAPVRLQDRAHDHVLRENERRRTTLLDTCCYIRDNPVRADLVNDGNEWPYSGAMLPGYPTVTGRNELWWEQFWKAYNACSERYQAITRS